MATLIQLPAGFYSKDWFTPNSYCDNFRELPSGPGIYLLVWRAMSSPTKNYKFDIMYVGMSKNIRARINGHPTKRLIESQVAKQSHDYKFSQVSVYFQPCCDKLRDLERFFIQTFNPPFNLIGLKRGIHA